MSRPSRPWPIRDPSEEINLITRTQDTDELCNVVNQMRDALRRSEDDANKLYWEKDKATAEVETLRQQLKAALIPKKVEPKRDLSADGRLLYDWKIRDRDKIIEEQKSKITDLEEKLQAKTKGKTRSTGEGTKNLAESTAQILTLQQIIEEQKGKLETAERQNQLIQELQAKNSEFERDLSESLRLIEELRLQNVVSPRMYDEIQITAPTDTHLTILHGESKTGIPGSQILAPPDRTPQEDAYGHIINFENRKTWKESVMRIFGALIRVTCLDEKSSVSYAKLVDAVELQCALKKPINRPEIYSVLKQILCIPVARKNGIVAGLKFV